MTMALIVLLMVFGWTAAAGQHHHPSAGAGALDKQRPSVLPGQSVFRVSSTWTDQNGVSGKLESLRGRPSAVAMVFTSCTTACPFLLADLKRIEAELPEEIRARIWIAIFSFDSERDRPATLHRFATTHDLDPARWRLHHGSPSAVRELAMALGIRYKRDARGDFDHSNAISILDREGVVRHQQVGLGQNPAESVGLLARLAR